MRESQEMRDHSRKSQLTTKRFRRKEQPHNRKTKWRNKMSSHCKSLLIAEQDE